MKPAEMEERWVSRKELADHLGFEISYVDRLVHEGCPSWKLGPAAQSPRRFRVSHVEGWLRARNGEGEAA